MRDNTKNRLGEKRVMKCGEECEIVEYRKYSDITIKFLRTGEFVKSTYDNFENGNIKSHFTPSVFGIGIVGLEKTKDDSGRLLKSYKTWSDMIGRCYNKNQQEKRPTYINCTVCDEWLFYPNFKKWYDENYYKVDNQKMCLDKDILFKDNKVYSPNTCVIVPERINTLFIKKDVDRGELPIGVSWHKRIKKYQSRCSVFDIQTNKNKRRNLGYHNTPEEAFGAYKQFKEDYIKQVADHYKDYIPSKLYEAMYGYKVEIED